MDAESIFAIQCTVGAWVGRGDATCQYLGGYDIDISLHHTPERHLIIKGFSSGDLRIIACPFTS